MGWKYETELFMYEEGGWRTEYQGQSLIAAVRSILSLRKEHPGRAYRIVIR
jgi:hypothetical protein